MTSRSFDHDEMMPDLYTGKGEDISPPLQWKDALQKKTKCYDPVMKDMDTPIGVCTRWIIYNIPAILEHISTDSHTMKPIVSSKRFPRRINKD